MALKWQKLGNLKGSKGDPGKDGKDGQKGADLKHAVGDIVINSTGDSPSGVYGGTWKLLPSLGGYMWKRTA